MGIGWSKIKKKVGCSCLSSGDNSGRICMNDVMNDDILLEILNRSTSCSKSIIQYKLVCKRWFNLINNPDFITAFIAHRTKNRLPRQELLTYSEKVHQILSPRVDEYVQIVASCNGLLLCLDAITLRCFICNPITKQWAEIPSLPSEPSYIGLICDPYYDMDDQGRVGIISPDCLQFKVVAISRTFVTSYANPRIIQMDIFSSKSGEWVQEYVAVPAADELCLINCFYISRSAVIYNQMMHWPASAEKILVYDPNTVKAHCFDGPPTTYIGGTYLGVCQNSLRVSHTWGCFLRIWELDDHKEWSMVHKVNLRVLNPGCSGAKDIYVVALSCDDQDTVYVMLGSTTLLVSCNLRRFTFKIIGKVPYQFFFPSVVSLLIPHWPTPLPPFPS
ncbi:putative F-box/kelch-repeat protein At4g22430 [Mercurialis annua]|uniref:putative F-box/kelch-repeat protein At4g22430 n=1 Tax=Mercurialis annua TaxID=3986 RepID=UPI0021602841|nr:putative F-box/kelch-repeat protein At4g22430 [Mercurialis annua]